MKNQSRKTFFCLLAYAAIRSVSYIFPPDTPLHGASNINTLIAILPLITVSYLLIKKNVWGWFIVAAEIILGGAGNFFAVQGISLRTCLLFISLSIFFIHERHNLKEIVNENRSIVYCFGFLYATVGRAAVRGYLAGHGLGAVFADTIPYFFFLYYFPLKKLLTTPQNEVFKNFVQSAVVAAILGSALFMLFTFITFSSGLHVLQDSFYHWFRDVAGGKITELPFHFYRIVLNEQLLLIPLLLVTLSDLIYSEKIKKLSMVISALLLSILAINLTRSFMLALGLGTVLLLRKSNWKRWLTVSTLAAGAFILIFTSIHFVASRGQSLGLEIFGLRLQSIVTPSLESSSLSRLLLLPKIITKIKANPILGSGLADTVTVYSPVVKKEITTSQFDWGYLEIWAELGIIGLLAWGALILHVLSRFKNNRFIPAWPFASVVALGVITLTSPALFHVLGIVWITAILSIDYSTSLNNSQKNNEQ